MTDNLGRPRVQAVRKQVQKSDRGFYSRRWHWRFVEDLARAPIHWNKEHWAVGGVVGVLSLLCLLVLPGWASVIKTGEWFSDRESLPIQLPAETMVAQHKRQQPELSIPHWIDGVYTSIAQSNDWTRVKIESGQTISDVFAALNIPSSVMQRLLEQTSAKQAMTQIRPGMQFAFLIPPAGSLQAVQFDTDEGTRKIFWMEGDSIREQQVDRVLEKRTRAASGVIEDSLFAAADAADVSDAVIMQLSKMFAYDVDFAQDIRRGDQFAVVYEEFYRDGERYRPGTLLAAEFTNRGKKHAAVRYLKPNGEEEYFTPEGRSLKKSFLRTPLEFTRISSKFASSRRHPILGTHRAHKGVDYAAPTGTPIWSAGDGKVQFRGWKSGYGNTIIVEHQRGVTTLYGHLSRFTKTLKSGQRVRQGEIIGFVGSTGLSTAPHLHYEFRINNTHRDPLTVTLPKALPLAGQELARFRAQTDPLFAQLALVDPLPRLRALAKN